MAGQLQLHTSFRNLSWFLFPGKLYLDVCSSLRSYSHPIYSGWDTSLLRWVPSFGYRDQTSLPTPHSFSQAVTSSSPVIAKASTIYLSQQSITHKGLCPQSHNQPITYTLISLLCRFFENFNESIDAITTRLSTAAISSRRNCLARTFVSFKLIMGMVWTTFRRRQRRGSGK